MGMKAAGALTKPHDLLPFGTLLGAVLASWQEVRHLRVVERLLRIIDSRWAKPVYGTSGGDSVRLSGGDVSEREPAPAADLRLNDRVDEEGWLVDGESKWIVVPIRGGNIGYLLCGPFTPRDTEGLEPVETALLSELLLAIADEFELYKRELHEAKGPVTSTQAVQRYSKIVGESPTMQQLFRLLDKVIESDSTVLIQGENGTGKELIAQAIHRHSTRNDHAFVVQNCSAFNDNLLDSELFGHRKGAFTGAMSDKRGLFEVADGGTFFLDEVGDMSPALQVKLLRVLQEGTFIPVGGTQAKYVDVRIIAATNRDLNTMMERGEFREDLYYRINVINITTPPLRNRLEDIPLLVFYFLRQQAEKRNEGRKRLSPGCLNALLSYKWPGNVRELENEMERLAVLAGEQPLVTEELLSVRIRNAMPTAFGHSPTDLPAAVENLERRMIYDVLKKNRWNKTKAAGELHISRRNLIRKVQKYNLEQMPLDGPT
jgi:two-component system, NtrC family, response regulator HupR/HoxA